MFNAHHGTLLQPSWCKTPKPVMVQDTQTRDGARHQNPVMVQDTKDPWWCRTPKPVMVQDTQTRDGASHQIPWWCKTPN